MSIISEYKKLSTLYDSLCRKEGQLTKEEEAFIRYVSRGYGYKRAKRKSHLEIKSDKSVTSILLNEAGDLTNTVELLIKVVVGLISLAIFIAYRTFTSCFVAVGVYLLLTNLIAGILLFVTGVCLDPAEQLRKDVEREENGEQ